MKLFLAKVNSIFDRVIGWGAAWAGILLIFMMLSVSAGVIERYLFNRTILWLLEVTEYSLFIMTFLAAAWVLKKEGHVKVDVVLNYLSRRNQALINTITSIIAASALFVITWYGIDTTWKVFQLGFYEQTMLSPPKWIFLSVVPFGGFLLFIQFLRRSYNSLRSWRASAEPRKADRQNRIS